MHRNGLGEEDFEDDYDLVTSADDCPNLCAAIRAVESRLPNGFERPHVAMIYAGGHCFASAHYIACDREDLHVARYVVFAESVESLREDILLGTVVHELCHAWLGHDYSTADIGCEFEACSLAIGLGFRDETLAMIAECVPEGGSEHPDPAWQHALAKRGELERMEFVPAAGEGCLRPKVRQFVRE